MKTKSVNRRRPRRRLPQSTLERAAAEVIRLRKRLKRLEAERNLMAMLASKTPMFSNPLHIWKAEEVRDSILQKLRSKP